MNKEIVMTVTDFVAEIVLNRPQKHNAITPEMAAALQEVCGLADRDVAVRVVRIRGAVARAFSSGSDLNSLAEYPSAWSFRNRVIYEATIRNIKKPVIAALKGWVLGGGAEMALAADMPRRRAQREDGLPGDQTRLGRGAGPRKCCRASLATARRCGCW
jgi:enoyl-CoA hydratase